MNEQQLINIAIDNFIHTGYINYVENTSDVFSEYETEDKVYWNSATFLYNGKEYSLSIDTPLFCSDEELDEKIANEFDEDYIIDDTFCDIQDENEDSILEFYSYELPTDLQTRFYNKIKQLVKDYNENV